MHRGCMYMYVRSGVVPLDLAISNTGRSKIYIQSPRRIIAKMYMWHSRSGAPIGDFGDAYRRPRGNPSFSQCFYGGLWYSEAPGNSSFALFLEL